MVKNAIIIVLINILWLTGGQGWLWARRYCLPVFAAGYAYFAQKDKARRWIAGVFVLLAVFLSMGYGENSAIRKALGGSDTLTRIVMACLISIVFASYSIMTHPTVWGILLTFGVNILAWQIRAGRICRIGSFDVLIEDIARATAFSISFMIA
jgi:hypothetical protein